MATTASFGVKLHPRLPRKSALSVRDEGIRTARWPQLQSPSPELFAGWPWNGQNEHREHGKGEKMTFPVRASEGERFAPADDCKYLRTPNSAPEKTSSSRMWCPCSACSRRGLITGLGGILFQPPLAANAFRGDEDTFLRTLEEVHPKRPDWYEEYFARAMQEGMQSYEKQIASYKEKLFQNLDAGRILELGVGTGPNLKFYAGREHTAVVGVDPNLRMERYARASASAAGLPFEFVHAVGEAIPLPDASVDAVVCTLVLCSVKSVESTLSEVKRVLKPGGNFLFLEHVVAPEGSSLRFWQNVLDPLQQLAADGCHLTRDTLGYIKQAGFKSVDARSIMVPNLSILSPHILGTAQTIAL